MMGWAERGDGRAWGHGNSVPRFHVAWGTGTGVSGPFAQRALAAERRGALAYFPRCRVDALIVEAGRVTGVSGARLALDAALRGAPSNRDAVGAFTLRALRPDRDGGIGGDHDRVRRQWPARLGVTPRQMIAGVPACVDGRGLDIAERAGARLVNQDRMWHYVEGVQNWDPIWPRHDIRILPGPSSL